MPANGFVWYELVTSDVGAAQTYYRAVLGWETQSFVGDGSGPPYTIVTASGAGVGGIMALTEGMSSPFWLGYVGVDDIAAAVRGVAAAGGVIEREFEIPTVGRIALVTDPQGVGIGMIQGASSEPSQAYRAGAAGHGNWHELHTTDWRAAFDFYSTQFGWAKGEAFAMGPTDTYQLFEKDGEQIGGMMNSPSFPRPSWLYYFGVDDIAAAGARITANGGTVLQGPHEVPGGQFIIQASDPQGALFAVVAPR